MQELVGLLSAPSAAASQEFLLRTWRAFHQAWFGNDVEVLPLTVLKVYAVYTMFRAGGHRAVDNYLSRIKDEHIGGGHCCHEFLNRAFRKVRRAVIRGIGPARQSAVLDMAASFHALRDRDGSPVSRGGPLGIRNLLVCAAPFG